MILRSLAAAALLAAAPAAQDLALEVRREVGIDQLLDAPVPQDVELTDSTGRRVRLGDLLDERPVILTLVYYECPMLCTVVLNELTKAMRAMKLDLGRDFDVVTVSIDPGEGPELAAKKRAAYLARYGREEARPEGWHMLVGDQPEIARLADAVGFRYRYDPELDEYAHAAAIFVITPGGRVSRVFTDIEFAPRDLRLSLVEASEGRIGTLSDTLALLCYHYDPTTGKYGFAVMSAVRILGGLTLVVLGSFLYVSLRRERRARRARLAGAGSR